MKTLKRNQRTFWYCLYKNARIPGDTSTVGNAIVGITVVGDDETNINYVLDEYGNETGELILNYAEPVQMRANISAARRDSTVQVEYFGNMVDYDRVIVTEDVNCPIDENTVLFIDKSPEYGDADTHAVTDTHTVIGGEVITPVTYRVPLYDYVVKRVARSINFVAIAVKSVKVG